MFDSCHLYQTWLVFLSPIFAKSGAGDMEMLGIRPSGYIVSALRFLFVDQLISNLHTSIILRISDPDLLTNIATIGNSCFWLVDF